MLEGKRQNIDKTELRAVAPIKKEKKFLGSMKLQKGQKCYEMNLKTGVISEAVYREECILIDKNTSIAKYKKKLFLQENCLYTVAINLSNAQRKFFKMINALNAATVKENPAL